MRVYLYFLAGLVMAWMVVARPIRDPKDPKDPSTPVNDKIREKFRGKFQGHGTFFSPAREGGDTGSCGPKENDNSDIVALNLHQYGNEDAVSEWCHKEVFIKYKEKIIKAKINDACPGCKPNSLDLTPKLFRKLAPFDKGDIPLEWCVADDPDCKDEMT